MTFFAMIGYIPYPSFTTCTYLEYMSWSLLISIDNILFINQVRLKFWRIHLKGHQYLFILLERGTCNMFPLKETYAPSSQLTWILITKGCLEPPLFSVFKVLMNLHHFVIRSYQLHVCALLNMKKISLIKPSNQSIGMFIRWLHTLQWHQNQWKCVKILTLLEILESKEVSADKTSGLSKFHVWCPLVASVEHHLDLPWQ